MPTLSSRTSITDPGRGVFVIVDRMYPQAHAGLGWVIGVLSPTSDRKLRGWCTAAAILPDADAAAMLLGVDAYARWHHKPGHNIFLGLLCVAAATVHFRKDPLRRMLTATT